MRTNDSLILEAELFVRIAGEENIRMWAEDLDKPTRKQNT